ncbi:hypothetical protein L1285_02070 [Pseudoalteromonas sp. DL2-H2.2]|uniref:hypothetical protein n=1 Tax=Pseudoalteromonas sp. DL2-H2.2 TaxID=2908889 RepID=UPI001F468223|nr:hypothetical protein [Pseudoalteromonas sp. DL2-H2.2]MCF2907131.1 hypothetical protein [Pseudoalteromonas sp. DL2-H2.2]
MQLPRNVMDIYFGYNFRVGDVKGAKEGIAEFEQIAQNATSDEERERYAQAAKQLRTEILPKMQKEMEQLGKQLGLKGGQIGKTVDLDGDALSHLAVKKDQLNGLSMITPYETGRFYHNKA